MENSNTYFFLEYWNRNQFWKKITGSVCTIEFNGHSSYPREMKTKQIGMTSKTEKKPAGHRGDHGILMVAEKLGDDMLT